MNLHFLLLGTFPTFLFATSSLSIPVRNDQGIQLYLHSRSQDYRVNLQGNYYVGCNVQKPCEEINQVVYMTDKSFHQAQSVSGIEYFPPGTLNELQNLTFTGLDVQQITNILGMINGPEQSNSKWWLTSDRQLIYAYAEDIGDGRGVTIGIYGATTGFGYRDADVIWENYNQNFGKLSKEEIIQKVHEVAHDHKWWKAQWDAYISTYWNPAVALLTSKQYTEALSIGVLVDTAMNAGMEDDDQEHWGVNHLFQEAIADTDNEQDFLEKFLELRLKFPTKNSGNMKKRVGAWQKLLRDRQWDMHINLRKYVYIP